MIIEAGLVKAGLVKIGLVRAIPSAITRYFRHNLGTTDYAQFAAPITLAGDFVIEMAVLVQSTGRYVLISSEDFTLQISDQQRVELRVRDASESVVISSSLSAEVISVGVLTELVVTNAGGTLSCKLGGVTLTMSNASNYFSRASYSITDMYTGVAGAPTAGFSLSGILANLKIWDNGVLITDCPIDEPSGAAIIDHASGNNATIINGLDSDRQPYTQQETGEWLHSEQWAFGDAASNGVEGAFVYFGGSLSVSQNKTYKWSTEVSGMTEGQVYLWGLSSAITGNGVYSGEGLPSSTSVGPRVGGAQCNAGTTFSDISIREVLNVA